MFRPRVVAGIAAWVMLPATLLFPSSAHAASHHDSGDVRFTKWAKGSVQRIKWNRSKRIVRLSVKTGANMRTDRCQEVTFDWRVPTGGGHYDQRTVRNCRPGSEISTDPGGDGYWNEPKGWDGRKVNGVYAAGALLLKDTTLDILDTEVAVLERRALYGYGTGYVAVPTQGQYKVATRTLRQNGKIISTRVEASPESCIEKATKRCTGGG